MTKLRAAFWITASVRFNCREVVLAVDAQVRFSWIMLGREPRSTDELLMVYAGIMAHGTSLTAVECAHDSAIVCHQHSPVMRWAQDERRLSQDLPGCAGIHAATQCCRHLGAVRFGIF